eukprot:UN25628
MIRTLRAVAVFQKDQIDQCIEHIWVAEKFLANSLKDDNWCGGRLMHGYVFLLAGCLFFARKNFVKGPYYFLRAWTIIGNCTEECREYEGEEANDVMSAIHLLHGILHIILSFLPPALVKMSETFGFRIDRDHGLEELMQCYEDGGFLAI